MNPMDLGEKIQDKAWAKVKQSPQSFYKKGECKPMLQKNLVRR
jgi:hypothetical protein